MKYRSLESIIKEVAAGYKPPSAYKSLEHSIRGIMEGKPHAIETDPNDQLTVGTYKTKSFEQSPEAQKLYLKLPKNTPPETAEKAAILHDKLFDMHKNVMATNRSTPENVSAAQKLIDQIKVQAKKMNLETEHGYLDRIMSDFNSHIDETGNVVNADKMDIEKLTSRFATPSYDQTKEKSDKDVDNSKMLVSRSIKAQRKIKIIDND